MKQSHFKLLVYSLRSLSLNGLGQKSSFSILAALSAGTSLLLTVDLRGVEISIQGPASTQWLKLDPPVARNGSKFQAPDF